MCDFFWKLSQDVFVKLMAQTTKKIVLLLQFISLFIEKKGKWRLQS